MSDLKHLEEAAAFDRAEYFKLYVTPLDDDEVELILGEILTTSAKLNRLCNLMLSRPKGLSVHALQSLEHLKLDTSWLKWHLENHRLPADATPAV